MASYLARKGYELLTRNFRSPSGEVDIICRKGQTLVFVEVKSWERLCKESLEYAINARKQERIKKTSLYYLANNPHLSAFFLRYDVVFCVRDGGCFEHLEDAF